MDNDLGHIARIDVATAPWFGNCIPCDRELGHPYPELVGRFIVDEPCEFNWLCTWHLTERIKAELG